MALSTFDKHECDKQKIIVLICDGDVYYVQPTIDRCIKDDIQIYAVNVGYAPAHAALQKMADQTGGEYYYASTADQLETVFAGVIGDTTGQIDTTDADGDGLYDIFETAGMQLANGQIIYTDPTNPDTDGDGLTDYQETGIVHNIDERYGGDSSCLNMKYFVMRSYPDQADSDGDGLTDDVDDRPLMVELREIARLNSKFSNYYLNIVDSNSNTYDGGDQGWWEGDVTSDNTMDHQTRLEKDKYYRLSEMGCGTIAMSDAELYMALQNSGYSLKVPPTFPADFWQTGSVKKNAYKDYIEQTYGGKYAITGGFVNKRVGLYPWAMESGLTDFLKTDKSSNKKVKWARYCLESSYKQTQDIVSEIERMLNEDIPVVFSYHSMIKQDIRFYTSLQNAEKNIDTGDDKVTDSHYMTIIGLYKCPSQQPWKYKYILEVVSWGEVYYIDFDQYTQTLDYFSNILSVY